MAMKKILSLALLILLLMSHGPLASAGELYVTPVRQAMSEWCWAACAEMVGTYEEPGSTRNQWDVVMYVKGAHVNVPGSLADSVAGSEFVCYFLSSFGYTFSAFSLSQITTMIDTYQNPLSTGCGYYNQNNQRVGGHMLVVTGVNGNNIKVIDPWDSTWEWVSYNFYLSGYGGRRYDQTVYTYN